MDCNILLTWHPVASIDAHTIVAPPLIPAVGPYSWGHVLGYGIPPAGKYATTVNGDDSSFWVVQRGSDLGMLIPHFGAMPNLAYPVILLNSGSKSEFGAFSVPAEGKPIAVAFPFGNGTLNLNCQGPGPPIVPLPTGIVAAFFTGQAGFKIPDDLIRSLTWMAFDMIVQGLLNQFGGQLGRKIMAKLGARLHSELAQALANQAFRENNAVAVWLGERAIKYSGVVAEALERLGTKKYANLITDHFLDNFLIGGPHGTSLPLSPGDKIIDTVGQEFVDTVAALPSSGEGANSPIDSQPGNDSITNAGSDTDAGTDTDANTDNTDDADMDNESSDLVNESNPLNDYCSDIESF